MPRRCWWVGAEDRWPSYVPRAREAGVGSSISVPLPIRDAEGLQLGTDAMVSVQAEMQEGSDAQLLGAEIDRVEREMKRAFPEVRFSFFEPDTSAD